MEDCLKRPDKQAAVEKQQRFSCIDAKLFPEDDPEVLRMVNEGATLGCFQLESPLMRGTLRKMQIERLEDFPVAIAIIRPGAAHRGKRDEYIKRRAGLEPTHYLHPCLEPVLKETYGVPVFQEQIMLIAREAAGFSLTQADGLRRAMTKERQDVDLVRSLERQFIEGALQKGLSHQSAEEIWQYIFEFTGFGFNKGHASTYGILAYQTAYLKCHHPVEFMTAVLNNPGAFYSNAVYIEECRRMGITILPPDVNYSDILFTLENKQIRVGLYPIFELTVDTQKKIVSERKKRPFKNLYDFLKRTRAGQKETEHLIQCGAFGSIHPSQPLLLMKTLSYFESGCNKAKAEYITQGLRLEPYSKQQRIVEELDWLGFSVTAHPLTLYDKIIPWNQMISSLEVDRYKDKKINFTGWYVTNRKHQTKAGELMVFLTLEDLKGTCDIVFFPKVFARHWEILQGFGPYTIKGRVQSRMKGEANLIAEKVHRWLSPKEVITQSLF